MIFNLFNNLPVSMKRLCKCIIIPLTILVISGCSAFNCTPLENLLGHDVRMIRLANIITDGLVKNAMPPLIPRLPQQAILTSTFVNLDNLEETSRFGRLLQEQIGARLVQHDYTVKEIHLRNTMSIRPEDGERMLSRKLSEIDPENQSQALLVGTYSLTNRTMYLTVKLVNPATRNILSAENYTLCADNTLLAMFGLQTKNRSHYYDDPIDHPRGSIIDEIFY